MKKQTHNPNNSIVYALIFLLVLVSCKKENDTGHVCRWGLCPYKGITLEQYKVKAKEIEGSDGYYLDLLHIEKPDLDYDELEDLLFKNNEQ